MTSNGSKVLNSLFRVERTLSVITIDAGFLLNHYKSILLMMCGYNAENKLLPLAFKITNEENLDN
jgi:hypothetical protein